MFSLLLIVLAACSENDVHEKIIEQLEAAYEAEQSFVASQEQLLHLEERDIEIYNEIIELDDVSEKRLNELTNEALEIVEKRKEFLEEERKSIHESKEHFQKVETLLEEIEDETEKSNLEKLYETMMERYESYEYVYDTYIESLYLTESLYEHLQQEATYTVLHDTLNKVNESYEKLFKANDQFNRLTKQYNHLKAEYYEMSME